MCPPVQPRIFHIYRDNTMQSRHGSTKHDQTTDPRSSKQAPRQIQRKDSKSGMILNEYGVSSNRQISPPSRRLSSKKQGLDTLGKVFLASNHTLPLAPFFQADSSDLDSSLLPPVNLGQLELTTDSSNTLPTSGPELRSGAEQRPTVHNPRASVRSLRASCDFRSSFYLGNSRSTLRLPTNGDSSMVISPMSQQHASISRPKIRKTKGSRDLRYGIDLAHDSFQGESITVPSRIDEDSIIRTSPKPHTFASILSVIHFQSFCVLDTQVAGCPVTSTTDDMRHIMETEERFRLEDQASKSPWVDIVVGTRPDGQEITYLVMFSPLIGVATETCRFLLTALVDVTEFIQDAANELNDESQSIEPTSIGSFLMDPDDLLGGCSLPDDDDFTVMQRRTSTQSTRLKFRESSEDIWLALAAEYREKALKSRNPTRNLSPGRCQFPSSQAPSLSGSTTTTSTDDTMIDNILSHFMGSLQNLYADYFILAKNPLDDQYFEISSVSPSVYVSGEYVTGHLTHTPAESVTEFSRGLAEGHRFRTIIRWGEQGQKMQCYSIPLHGLESITWLCMLVNMEMPLLW